MSWQQMADLAPYDLLTAAYMDVIRENLEFLFSPPGDVVFYDAGSAYSTSNTEDFDPVDATNVKLVLTTNGGPVRVDVIGTCWTTTGVSNGVYFSVSADGDLAGHPMTGLQNIGLGTGFHRLPLSFTHTFEGLEPGEHTFLLEWRVSGYTGYLFQRVFLEARETG